MRDDRLDRGAGRRARTALSLLVALVGLGAALAGVTLAADAGISTAPDASWSYGTDGALHTQSAGADTPRGLPSVGAMQPAPVLSVTCDWSGQSYGDFYDPPDLGDDPLDRLGELLRVEYIRSYTPEEVANAADLPESPYGAVSYRVLYLSQTPTGVAVAVSGLMIVPTGTVPAEGLPVLSWGHYTTGIPDKCAPSKAPAFHVRGLLYWIANGYVVASTDYAGLGMSDNLRHPFIVGASAAYSMLDGARAALRFCDDAQGIYDPLANNQGIVAGWSQGGHSALFAHQYWASYAPDLEVLGTVAFAPGSEPRRLAEIVAEGIFSKDVAPTVMAMFTFMDYYDDPLPLDAWLLPEYANEIETRIDDDCIVPFASWIGTDADVVFQPGILAAVRSGLWDDPDLAPFAPYMDLNTPGNYRSEVPVLIFQGDMDEVIPPELSQRLRVRLCVNEVPVTLSVDPDATHWNIVSRSRSEALQWMTDRLSGLPDPRTCNLTFGPLIRKSSP